MRLFRKRKNAIITGIIVAIIVAVAISRPWVKDLSHEERYELTHAEKFELISIEPMLDNDFVGARLFGRYPILGIVNIEDAATRDRLVAALREGIQNHDGRTMACFDPRHAIRVTRSRKVTTFLICFQCKQGRVYQDDRTLPSFTVTSSPEPVFDEILTAHGVPLAAKSH